MIRNLLFTFGIFLFASLVALGQPGTLKGKILDKETKEPIPFASVILENGGTQVGGTTSDFDGNYVIKPIPPGTYDLKASSVGYKPMMVQGMLIKAGAIEFYDIKMSSTKVELTEVEVVEYKVPLIQKDKTQTGATVTKEDIAKMPNRNANSIATTVGGVFSQDGERGSVRGARSEETVTYIDGVKVIGSANLPASALEQVSVMLGGTPAMFGDVTGGVISITTRGPSRQFNGGLELRTSKFLDAYGHNAAEFNLTGPLFKGKDKNSATSLLGFFLAGNFTYNESSSRKSAVGFDRATDAFIKEIGSTPVLNVLQPGGTYGLSPHALYMQPSDMENVKVIPNTSNMNASVTAKIDVKTSKNTTLTLGGGFTYDKDKFVNYTSSMFNFDNPGLKTEYSWRTYAKFTQKFPTNSESSSLVKNFFYSVQVDYSQRNRKYENEKFQDDLFKYGYIGKFETMKTPTYQYGHDDATGMDNVYSLNSWSYDTAVVFTPYQDNMTLAMYNNLYYEQYPETQYHMNLTQIQAGGGLLNGSTPSSIYSLWTPYGVPYGGNSKLQQDRLGVNVSSALDIGSHEVKFGFQYEQMQERYMSRAPMGLWGSMRGLVNSHIKNLDTDNPYLVYSDGIFHANETPSGTFMDTVIYYRKVGPAQYTIDKNLRRSLGLAIDGTDYIDIDSYDMENNTINVYDKDGKMKTMTLDKPLNIDMFSDETLMTEGLVRAYGYDYSTGKALKGKTSFDDFFTKRDDQGNLLRHRGAYEPIYMAGYIQDKFDFNGDLVVNVGVRVDRFDANQLVLKDPYLFAPAKTAGELTSADYANFNTSRPGNIGDDYVVYVNDISNPSSIVGYRDGDVWYGSQGEITTVGTEEQKPYLLYPSATKEMHREAFKDYDPQWSVMPRLSFSFPVSDEALFFAHYDILTQRPLGRNIFDPSAYYLALNGAPPGEFSNPDLKPKKTIDYELGFQQKLTNSSSLSIAAYYKEIRNLVQYSRFTGAYPKSYFTYKNIDFGTIKGLTLTYDLRRTKNVRLRAAYTLQFAEGTGSSTSTARALIQAQRPNLRMLSPLSYDRRHAINISLDYRYGSGKNYDGPTINRKDKAPIQLLANTGASVTINGGSGTPYTRSARVAKVGTTNNVLEGTINGSRLPWSFRMDLRLDKDFKFKFSKGKKDARTGMLNVYLSINNLLNMQNVIGVYAYTGQADDDGYLTSPLGIQEAKAKEDSEAYKMLYASYVNSPWNYSLARSINLGLIFSF